MLICILVTDVRVSVVNSDFDVYFQTNGVGGLMVEERRPDENGNGQNAKGAEPPPDSPPESPPGRLKQLFAKDLEHVGLIVFAITAIATILFIAGFNFFSSDAEMGSYRHLRSAELMLTLAATSLVVAMIGRAQNPFVLTFGILLIGALIVPSGDLVKFALIASGSDKTYGSFSQSAGSGTDLAGRSTDVANKILTELDLNDFLLPLVVERRKVAIIIVEDEVRKEREITLLEQVRARGALDALKAMDNDVEGWVYKYGSEEKFVEDLRYLRSEDLLSFAYDDLDTIDVTLLGETVLARADPESAGGLDSGASLSADSTAFPRASSEQFGCPSDFERFPDVSNELKSAEGRLMNLERGFQYMRFEVDNGGNYRIDVKVISEWTVDPILEVFYLADADNCIFLGDDDDGGDDLNSRMLIQLEPGKYLIATKTLSPIEGDVRVSVARMDPGDSGPTDVPSNEVEDRGDIGRDSAVDQ